MNLIFTATLSFLWLIQTSSSLQYEEEPNQSSFLMKLDKSNFEATVFRSGKNGMVKFYQSWCGRSIKMKPTWNQLAELSHSSVFIANVDCGAERELCQSYHISTYPTFRYYLNGVEHDYEDAQSLAALREFVDTTLIARCDPIKNLDTCSERALKYANKWIYKLSSSSDRDKILRSEIDRLKNMLLNEETVTIELKRWIRERRDILDILQRHKIESLPQDLDKNHEL